MQIPSMCLSNTESLCDSNNLLKGHGELESDNSASWGFRLHQNLMLIHIGRGSVFFKGLYPRGFS